MVRLALVSIINLPSGEQKFTKAGQYDHLFKNLLVESGELRFEDVSKAAGIDGPDHGLDVTWWDYDEDGWPDLYVATPPRRLVILARRRGSSVSRSRSERRSFSACGQRRRSAARTASW